MRIAIVTENVRVYYMATKVLRDYGILFYSLRPRDEIPFDVEVVLTSEEEYSAINFPVKIAVVNENFIDALLSKLEGRERFKNIYVAIDPGERPGVAVVADNRVIEVHHLKNPKDIDVILNLLEKYPGAKVKIGHGAKRYRSLMLKNLANILGEDFPIFLVNERRTTPKVGGIEASQVQDIVASINIALRDGRETTIGELMHVGEPTKGEIDYIKTRSRELSNGMITISSRLAREVAKGNLTLEEAIEIHKKKKR